MNANKNTISDAIIDYLADREDEFNEIIEELDTYNGYLGDDRYYSMGELPELFSGADPIELLNRAFFGYDEETWNTDSHGNKEYGAFNPNRDYFRFNGYGNLVSSDHKDYSDKLDRWFIESVQENRANLWTLGDNPELSDLFDQLDAASNSDDE